jgi:hypothetical protein
MGRSMKITIEPEAARPTANDPSVALPGPKTARCDGSIILPFTLEPQELSRWCWAAVAASMARFYRTGTWRQRDVAGRVFGVGGSGSNENLIPPQQWDQNRTLDEALQVVGCFSHWSPGKPDFERIVTELESGRPMGIRIEWRQGGAHYVAISGYDGPRREIRVADPKWGVSQQSFDRFPHDYQSGGGVWTETFWTGVAAAAVRPIDHQGGSNEHF